jgi:hypothetical protein
MRNLQNLAVVSSLAISSLAAAQNAVEWRVADGGNGHWYEVNLDYHGWNAARTAALAIGGDLASLETNAEWNWTRTWLPSVLHGYLIGGRQLPKSSSPSDGWKWLTGGDVQREWMLMDDNPCGIYPANVEDDQQDYLHTCCGETAWGDINDRGGCEIPLRSLVEWSADCNNDGLVDYGQILDGTFTDSNHNNIPDCCEAGSPCPDSAVQWRVAVGGNGHWYQRIDRNDQSWTALRALCEARGGHLVSITSAAESSMAVAVMAGQSCIIGGFQDRKASNYLEPAGGWRWCTNEPIEWSNWNQAEPNNATGLGEDIMAAYPSGLWVDLSNLSGDVGWPVSFAIIEWSADCNADGLIDYGQILDGSLPDANHNNIPDCCEGGVLCDPCPGDVDNSGAVNGVDLAAILNTWGTTGGKYPGADVNHDGIVNGTDLAEVLNGWGPCP